MFAETIYDFILMGFYVLVAFLYCGFLVFVSRVEYHYKKNKYPLTDEACLERLAKKRGLSEYAVFLLAAHNWNVSEQQARTGFKIYLKTGDIPHYVRDFVRQHKQEIENNDPPYFPFRNSPPPACPG